MSYQVDAIYDHGVFKPLSPLTLPDQAHVKLTVDAPTIDAEATTDPEATQILVERQRQARLELAAKLKGTPDRSPDDGLTSADHDQILYGRPA